MDSKNMSDLEGIQIEIHIQGKESIFIHNIPKTFVEFERALRNLTIDLDKADILYWDESYIQRAISDENTYWDAIDSSNAQKVHLLLKSRTEKIKWTCKYCNFPENSMKKNECIVCKHRGN